LFVALYFLLHVYISGLFIREWRALADPPGGSGSYAIFMQFLPAFFAA